MSYDPCPTLNALFDQDLPPEIRQEQYNYEQGVIEARQELKTAHEVAKIFGNYSCCREAELNLIDKLCQISPSMNWCLSQISRL